MNIGRQGAGTPPRIEPGNVNPSLGVAIDGEPGGVDEASQTFASVLTAMEVAVPFGAREDAHQVAKPELLPVDPATFLRGGREEVSENGIDAQATSGGQVDLPALAGASALMPLMTHATYLLHDEARSVGLAHEGVRASGVPDMLAAAANGSVIPMADSLDAQAAATKHGVVAHAAEWGGSPARGLPISDSSTHHSSIVSAADDKGQDTGLENLQSGGRAMSAALADRLSFLAAPSPDWIGGGFKPLSGIGQRSAERGAGRAVLVPLEGALAGSGASPMLATNAVAGGCVVAGPDVPFAAGASSELAHKVHYWVTRGAQNAQWQLDAFGGGAVDVSIAMRGNEAQVEFRSDQPEARRLLQEAMPQLRDLLRSEGLELSGGFVGGSSQQDLQRERDDSGKPGVRVATAAVPGQPVSIAIRTVAMKTHALDVFV